MELYFSTLKKYAVFSGRASRAEYWTFFFVNTLIYIAIAISERHGGDRPEGFLTMTTLFGLLLTVPSIAVGVRRLHDTGRSAWWLLLALIPFAGALALLVMYCLPGNSGDNEYGADPYAPTAEEPAAGNTTPPPQG